MIRCRYVSAIINKSHNNLIQENKIPIWHNCILCSFYMYVYILCNYPPELRKKAIEKYKSKDRAAIIFSS